MFILNIKNNLREKKTMDKDKYQGSANYSTWLVSLFINNNKIEQDFYIDLLKNTQ